jgi:hypothetical protein
MILLAVDACIRATQGMPLEDFLSKFPEKDYKIIRRAEYIMIVPKRGMGRNHCTVSHDGQKITGTKTGLEVYFTDPYALCLRGTNENTNGLLRQYFPKGTDFRNVSEKDIAIVVKKINNRPRKCLNYQTPHEVYCQALRGCGAL